MSGSSRYKRIALILGAGGAVAFAVACGAYYLEFRLSGISGSGEDWSNFGQYIGGISGSAIAVVTLVALSYNLRLQAEELEKTGAMMLAQSKTMTQQAFDSVFFRLLDRFSGVRDSVVAPETVPGGLNNPIEVVRHTGRQAFHHLYGHLAAEYHDAQGTIARRDYLQTGFLRFYDAHESELGPYFRTLYHVFKFLDLNATLTDKEKVAYANIARAQLANIELAVIFYDGLTALAGEFKPLIEKYGILKHVNAKTLIDMNDIANTDLYRRSAFQSHADRQATSHSD